MKNIFLCTLLLTNSISLFSSENNSRPSNYFLLRTGYEQSKNIYKEIETEANNALQKRTQKNQQTINQEHQKKQQEDLTKQRDDDYSNFNEEDVLSILQISEEYSYSELEDAFDNHMYDPLPNKFHPNMSFHINLANEREVMRRKTEQELAQASLVLATQITAIKSSQASLPKINTATSLQQTTEPQKYTLPTPYHFYQTPSLPRGPKVASDGTIKIQKDHAGAILLSIMQKYETQKPILLLKNEPENKDIAQTPSIPQPLITKPQIPTLKEYIPHSSGALQEIYDDGTVVELYPQSMIKFLDGKSKPADLAKRIITLDQLIVDHYADGKIITDYSFQLKGLS